MRNIVSKFSALTLLFIITFCCDAFAARCKTYDDTHEGVGRYSCVYSVTRRSENWKVARQCRNGKFKIISKSSVRENRKKFRKWKKANGVCKNLATPTSRTSLSNLPSLNEMLGSDDMESSTVSGTPPTFSAISNGEGGLSAESLFWREVDGDNVITALINGTPTSNQCDEFWSGASDDASGGFGACEGVLGAARSLAKPLEAAISSCYLSNIASRENAADNGIRRISGRYPGGNVENLFNTPSGSRNRIVKIQFANGAESNREGEEEGGGPENQEIFVKVYSENNNESNNNRYRADLIFCDIGSDSPSGYEEISISNDNIFTGHNLSSNEGSVEVTLQAPLQVDEEGDYDFDPSGSRSADIKFIWESEEGSFKFRNVINVDNGEITLKTFDKFGGETRLGYSKTSITGSDLDSLRVHEGATKHKVTPQGDSPFTFTSAFEYSDTYYSAAPGSALESDVNSFNFDDDSFYATEPSITDDSSDFRCDLTPHIVVELNMNSESMQAIGQECEGMIPRNTDICRSENLDTAETNWFLACSID